MNDRARLLPLLTLPALLAVGGCRRAKPTAVAPLQTMEDLALRHTVRGILLWELEARTAILHDEAGEAQLAEPRMRFYRNGRLASRLSAHNGRVLVQTHDVFLSNSVVLDTVEERTVLRTETLNYSSKRDLMTTDAEVHVQRPEGRLLGRGLEAKPDLSEIHVFNQRSDVKARDS